MLYTWNVYNSVNQLYLKYIHADIKQADFMGLWWETNLRPVPRSRIYELKWTFFTAKHALTPPSSGNGTRVSSGETTIPTLSVHVV